MPVPIAILGFSTFERRALLAYLQPAPGRRQVYRPVAELAEATFVVADGDDAATLALLQRLDREADAIYVGHQAPARAAAWVMRPLSPEAVLRELAELRRQRRHPDTASLPLGLPRDRLGHADARGPSPRFEASGPGALAPPFRQGRRLDDPRPSAPTNLRTVPAAAAAAVPPTRRHTGRPAPPLPAAPRRVLVVDDSAIALHFMQRVLKPYGLAVALARSGAQALQLLASRHHGLVFLDLDLGGPDRQEGLALCRRILQPGTSQGARPPVVVMVSAFHDPVDQVRGTLAGAQAYLAKPLDLAALDRLMVRLGVAGVAGVAPRLEDDPAGGPALAPLPPVR